MINICELHFAVSFLGQKLTNLEIFQFLKLGTVDIQKVHETFVIEFHHMKIYSPVCADDS